LQKSLKDKYISILPIENSFFYSTTIDDNIKFNRQTLYLNFAHISPYQTFEIIPFYEGKNLLLWFTPKLEKTINIPYGYLLFLELLKEDENAIFIIEDEVFKITVIKDGVLKASFVSYNMGELEKQSLLDEYQLQNIYIVSKNRYNINTLLNNYSILNYYKWYSSEQSLKDIGLKYLDLSVVPIIIIISIFISFELLKDNYIEERYHNLEQEYLSVKKKNDNYRENLRHQKEIKEFFNGFYYDILIYPNSFKVISTICDIVAKDKDNKIKYLKLSGDTIRLSVETHNGVPILNQSLKSGYFKEFKIKSTRELRRKKINEVTFEGKLKKLQKSIDG